MTKVRVNLGRSAEDAKVSLFEIYNTSQKRLLVLAHDRADAASIADAAAHIYYKTRHSLFGSKPRHIRGEEALAERFARTLGYNSICHDAAP